MMTFFDFRCLLSLLPPSLSKGKLGHYTEVRTDCGTNVGHVGNLLDRFSTGLRTGCFALCSLYTVIFDDS